MTMSVETPIGLEEAVGIGVDVAEVAAFEALPFDQHHAFYRRMFSPDEIAYCRSQAAASRHFAARFAAKEAAVKALSGVVELGYWQVEVVRNAVGAPALRFWNENRTDAADELDAYRSLLSLSHTDALATAFVVVFERRTHACN
jgi:holo-[acyl-carrier protein] synthase